MLGDYRRVSRRTVRSGHPNPLRPPATRLFTSNCGNGYLYGLFMASLRLLNLVPASLEASTSRSSMSDPDEPAEGAAECAPHPASPAKLGDQVRPAILSALVLTLLTGCVFPVLLAVSAGIIRGRLSGAGRPPAPGAFRHRPQTNAPSADRSALWVGPVGGGGGSLHRGRLLLSLASTALASPTALMWIRKAAFPVFPSIPGTTSGFLVCSPLPPRAGKWPAPAGRRRRLLHLRIQCS